MQILVMYNSLKPFQGAKGKIDREAHFPTSLSQQLLIIIVGIQIISDIQSLFLKWTRFIISFCFIVILIFNKVF